jgi:hypothetical protein
MALYYGRHKVRDYAEWRPYFDGDQGRLSGLGVKLIRMMQTTDNPNEVHFIFDIPDFEAFINMLQNPESQDLLQKAGVLERPTIYKLHAMVPEEAMGASGN